MKTTQILFTLAAALCGLALHAQTPTPPAATLPTDAPTVAPGEPRPGRPNKGEMRSELKQLAAKLGLDDAQKKMVRTLLKERRDLMQKLDKAQRWGEEGKRLRAESHAKIRALLSPDQQAKFDTWVSEKKEKYRKQRPSL
jgi:Spy/CpxP family protein refolding chaperone